MPSAGNLHLHTSIADNWGFSTGNVLAYVQIRMPNFSGEEYNSLAVDGDVTIAGFSTAHPDNLWVSVLNPGVQWDVSSGGFVRFDGERGTGGRAIFWDDYTLPSADPLRQFPPGMDFSKGDSNASFITSLPGGPTEIGTFTFTLGINLPGSMRIWRDFSFTVEEVPGVLLGDVDGINGVTLVDLIYLDKHLRDPTTVPLPNPPAAIIAPPLTPGRPASNADLNRLAEYFAIGTPLR
jgi:hypothetical protein